MHKVNLDFDLDLIEVYPNPTSDLVYINAYDFNPTSLKIIDAFGKVVENRRCNANEAVDVKGLSAGTYNIELQNEKGAIQIASFVVQR